MANEEDVEELKDLVKFLENALQSVSNSGDKFAEKIISATRQSVNLKNVFEELVDTMDDLPKDILNAKDLQQAMLKDAKLFNKVQNETRLVTEKALKEGWQKIHANLKKNKATTEEINVVQAEYDELVHSITQDFDKQFLLMQRQAKEAEKIKVSFVDIKKEMDALGAAIRDPGQGIDNLLGNISAIPNKLREASEKAGGFGQLMKNQGKKIAMFFGPAGLLALGFAGLVGSIVLVFKTFSNLWGFIDKKVMPATAALNKEFGAMGSAMGPVRKEVMSAGVQFEMLGKSFAEGAQTATKFFGALMHVPGTSKAAQIETQKLAKTGLMLSEYVGLGAEQSGKLVLQLQKAGVGVGDFNQTMNQASDVAAKFGVPVNQIRKDMGENLDILSRFGIRNRITFLESAARARSYGLSIREVNAAFSQQMDTFEGSSDAAAKLNAIFGTHINSYKLMLETDPTKRMEMLRSELVNQGKEWDNLNVFEQNVITSTLGVNKEQAALILSSDKRRRQLEAEVAQKKRAEKIDRDWNKGLSNIKETLIAWGPLIDKVMRSMAMFFGKVLFGMDTTKGFNKTAQQLEGLLQGVSKWFDQATVAAGEQGLTGILMDAPKFLSDFNTTMKDTKEFVSDVSIAIAALGDTIDSVFEPIDSSRASTLIEKLRTGLLTDEERSDIKKKLEENEDVRALFEKKLKREGGQTRDQMMDLLTGGSVSKKNAQNQLTSTQDALSRVTGEIEELKKKKKLDSKEFERLHNLEVVELPKLNIGIQDLNASIEHYTKQMEKAGPMPISVNDALITKRGEIVKFNPEDNIIASKGTPKVEHGGSQQNIEKIVRTIMREMKTEIKVEVMDIKLDGKKVGEAQVKISRN